MKNHNIMYILVITAFFLISKSVIGQNVDERARYLTSQKETLQMLVHIWGEVNKPGEYVVSDHTNVLELISKAGGPTEFAKLSNVTITRAFSSIGQSTYSNHPLQNKRMVTSRIEDVNLEKYLQKKNSTEPLPVLLPGDVVTVHKNLWYNWHNIVGVARDVAIVASVYFWYKRASNE